MMVVMLGSSAKWMRYDYNITGVNLRRNRLRTAISSSSSSLSNRILVDRLVLSDINDLVRFEV
jgi:hypothetical protein